MIPEPPDGTRLVITTSATDTGFVVIRDDESSQLETNPELRWFVPDPKHPDEYETCTWDDVLELGTIYPVSSAAIGM